MFRKKDKCCILGMGGGAVKWRVLQLCWAVWRLGGVRAGLGGCLCSWKAGEAFTTEGWGPQAGSRDKRGGHNRYADWLEPGEGGQKHPKHCGSFYRAWDPLWKSVTFSLKVSCFVPRQPWFPSMDIRALGTQFLDGHLYRVICPEMVHGKSSWHFSPVTQTFRHGKCILIQPQFPFKIG